MVKNVEVYPLLSSEQSPDRQLEIAEGVQRFVYEDVLRVDPSATEAEVLSVADPTDKDRVERQLQDMLHPPMESTQWLGVYADEEWKGVAKVGPWRYGDEGKFGEVRKKIARIKEIGRHIDTLPSGLHVMAVEKGLVRAALKAIYFDYVPDGKQLRASVHEKDDEMQEAFTLMGAPVKGPTAKIILGNYVANYTRRVLPPH